VKTPRAEKGFEEGKEMHKEWPNKERKDGHSLGRAEWWQRI